MTRAKGSARCSACGAARVGKFCAHCGAAFGNPADAAPPARRSSRSVQFLGGAGAALLLIVVYLVGRATAPASSGAQAATPAVPAAIADISQLSPAERASRLYDRVMMDGENGHLDSARFFAPMALQAYDMLGIVNAHTRYDVGMIRIVSGDTAAARAEADTILKERPTHLLGLALAMRASGGRPDRARFARRLLAASAAETAAALPEYTEHRTDVDGALASARKETP